MTPNAAPHISEVQCVAQEHGTTRDLEPHLIMQTAELQEMGVRAGPPYRQRTQESHGWLTQPSSGV